MVRVCTDNITSTLHVVTKASVLDCATVWPVGRTFQNNSVAGLYGVVAVQWLLMFYSILYIIVAPLVAGER